MGRFLVEAYLRLLDWQREHTDIHTGEVYTNMFSFKTVDIGNIVFVARHSRLSEIQVINLVIKELELNRADYEHPSDIVQEMVNEINSEFNQSDYGVFDPDNYGRLIR